MIRIFQPCHAILSHLLRFDHIYRSNADWRPNSRSWTRSLGRRRHPRKTLYHVLRISIQTLCCIIPYHAYLNVDVEVPVRLT